MAACQVPPRPVMRYHGGKYRLAPWIVSQMPPHRAYTEAFAGAASVLLHKPRAYAEIVGDIDGQVVNLLRVLRDRAAAGELRRVLRLTPYARVELVRAYEPCPDDPVEQARRTLVKAQMSFSSDGVHSHRAKGMRTRASTWRDSKSGFRAGTARTGTTPAHDWASYPDAIEAITARLQGVVVEHRPAALVIAAHDRPDTLHYVDPPYVHSTRSQSSGYADEMSDEDHRGLAALLHACRGMVMLSGYASDLYEELYAGWTRVSTQARASGQVASVDRTEVLWLNPAAVRAKGQMTMF